MDTKNYRAMWFVHVPQNVSSDRILRAKKPLNEFCCIAGAGKTDKEREKSGNRAVLRQIHEENPDLVEEVLGVAITAPSGARSSP